MKMVEFSEFLQDRLDSIKSVLDSKSADYSYEDDKLFNFKLAAKVGGVTPIEALRGMQLKHKTSLRQGLDELKEKGTLRSWDWWLEKATDDINYTILLLAPQVPADILASILLTVEFSTLMNRINKAVPH